MQLNQILKTLAASSLIGSVIASPIGHIHHGHRLAKKEVVDYVTELATTMVTVTAGAGAESSTATTAVTTSEVTSESSFTPPTISIDISLTGTSTGSETSETSGSSSDFASSTSSSSSSTASSSGSFDAGAKGISYSPYTSSGDCKSLDDVKTDLETLTGYEIIRIYGVDCSQVEYVLQAKADGQKIFAAVYDLDSIASDVSTIAGAVESYGSWDDIYTVSVGNELVNDGEATVSEVASYVSTARSALTSAGYTGPVVAVDTFIAVIENTGLCEISDYIAVNAHPYFDGGVAASGAATWVLEQIENVANACNDNKTVLITETGWPTEGDTNGDAVPSTANQEIVISDVKSTCGDDVLLFTAYNDLWKAAGTYGVEQYWGIYSSSD
ncbi:hypothetical protein PACTADRAFT_16274 [Pachysolen tannophilus NRRL Y-2460]|uniref:Glycoside hydrolase family 17 protein n=1 Tax=Pachysolen tannophilus NRRL Y-2460 TaxID=669874 RepID=A0A1E4TWJ2_PACTA|nr:hypothetical protein PACTADRAFT_16274 [Pachysolen tannophilus NRRL Y-2460]